MICDDVDDTNNHFYYEMMTVIIVAMVIITIIMIKVEETWEKEMNKIRMKRGDAIKGFLFARQGVCVCVCPCAMMPDLVYSF